DLTSGMAIVSNGAPSSGAGTSLSSPLWVGMWARVQAASRGVTSVRSINGRGGKRKKFVVTSYPGLGFANPSFYRVGTDTNNADRYANDFTDITMGTNGTN